MSAVRAIGSATASSSNFESRGYGPITFHRALEVSCDTVFYDVAYRSWLALGGLKGADAKDPFITTVRDFGLGKRTGIDLPGESAGRIPDRAWKRAGLGGHQGRDLQAGEVRLSGGGRRRSGAGGIPARRLAKENCESGAQFRAGDAANFAIGQGDVATTPLQMGVAYAAIAGGGVVRTPRVGVRIVDPVSGVAQADPGRSDAPAALPKHVAAYVQAALRSVVVSRHRRADVHGHGRGLAGLGEVGDGRGLREVGHLVVRVLRAHDQTPVCRVRRREPGRPRQRDSGADLPLDPRGPAPPASLTWP